MNTWASGCSSFTTPPQHNSDSVFGARRKTGKRWFDQPLISLCIVFWLGVNWEGKWIHFSNGEEGASRKWMEWYSFIQASSLPLERERVI